MKKTALITGSSRGIGAACARALSASGHDVIINYFHSESQAQLLAAELGASAIKTDVSDSNQVNHMFDVIQDVDILVCNAGISLTKLFGDTTDEEWHKIFAVNVNGVVNCCRAALPAMIRKKSGKIITMSSIWGITGASCESAYSASKSAVIGLTKALAKELGPSGITVNCVAPGVIETKMNEDLTKEALSCLKDQTPLGSIGTPEEVAALVKFLASAESGFITGQVISPNGGFLI